MMKTEKYYKKYKKNKKYLTLMIQQILRSKHIEHLHQHRIFVLLSISLLLFLFLYFFFLEIIKKHFQFVYALWIFRLSCLIYCYERHFQYRIFSNESKENGEEEAKRQRQIIERKKLEIDWHNVKREQI